MSRSWVVAALYRFTPIEQPRALKGPLLSFCEAHDIVGVLLLAEEGVNGTIAGTAEGVDAFLDRLREVPGLEQLEVKRSTSDLPPFYRMRIRVKQEIVTMGRDGIDPRTRVGVYVEPEAWNALLDEPNVVVVDTRNDYEVRTGTFEGAVDPRLSNFREFPSWASEHLERFKHTDTKIAMFCTGGIRCEKASAWLLQAGFRDVYHLRGGILRYLEQTDPAESKWRGECFVFDQRVTVDHSLQRGSYALCFGCKEPVAPKEMESEGFEYGVSCPRCAPSLSEDVRERRRERVRQLQLAHRRGTVHLGAAMPAAPVVAPPAPATGAVLYSFRRCPFAIRARMALAIAGCNPELREVELRKKPVEMSYASSRGTVPLLVLEDGRAIEESLDIMDWALRHNDPGGWMTARHDPELEMLLRANDGPFKHDLDRYKYPERRSGASLASVRESACEHLENLERRLADSAFLAGDELGFHDAALFPFIRQFAAVDPAWFESAPFPGTRAWRARMLAVPEFTRVMGRVRPWKTGDEPLSFLDTLETR